MNVFDLHCDTLSRLLYDRRKGTECGLLSNDYHIDLEKMGKGNYLAQCFAIFVDMEHSGDPLLDALKMIDIFYEEIRKNSDIIAPVSAFSDIENNRSQGKISAILTMEEGAVCLGSLEVLRDMHRMGVRMMTLTWNYENMLAYPNNVSYDGGRYGALSAETEKGVKDKGYEFLDEMERLGIVIDVSHLSDAGFWDIYKHTKKPFVASHSNSREVCLHIRNLDDDMIKAVAERGGVIGLNFCPAFLNEKGIQDKSFPSRIDDMVRHIKHIANLGGIGVLALGSDYDGIGGTLELADASYLPRLYDALRTDGFCEGDIDKIFYKNAMRVFKETM